MTKRDPSDDRILRAAGRLFRDKGFEATTVREIAAAAELLPGSLHYRYPSKDEILVALMERGVEEAIDTVTRAIHPLTDPLERIHAGLRAHVELLCSGEDSLHALLFDWRSLTPAAHQGVERERRRYEYFWDGLLLAAYATGRGRKLDLELVRQLGFGAVNWVATWYTRDGRRTPAQIADAFFNYLSYGLVNDSSRPADLDARFDALRKD